jgi:hypothetical protein
LKHANAKIIKIYDFFKTLLWQHKGVTFVGGVIVGVGVSLSLSGA